MAAAAKVNREAVFYQELLAGTQTRQRRYYIPFFSYFHHFFPWSMQVAAASRDDGLPLGDLAQVLTETLIVAPLSSSLKNPASI